MLVPCWLKLALCWPKLAPSWPLLADAGSKLSYVASMLAHVGPMLAHVGPMLAHVGSKLRVSCLCLISLRKICQISKTLKNELKTYVFFLNGFAMFLKVVGIQVDPMLAHAGSYLAYACLVLP